MQQEQSGGLDHAARTDGKTGRARRPGIGYRVFDESALDELAFITGSRELSQAAERQAGRAVAVGQGR